MRATLWLVVSAVSMAACTAAHSAGGYSVAPPPFGSEKALQSLPNAPEKALVLQYCSVCHDVDWIVRSAGTVDDWTDRIQRMIRGGATIPRDQVPRVAAYLAKAFPPRPRSTREQR